MFHCKTMGMKVVDLHSLPECIDAFCESKFFNKSLNFQFLFFYKNICETIKKYLIYVIYLRNLGRSQRDEVYEEI